MAPRRGGAGGAGAEVALGGGRGYFEPPPLKRMQPWAQDGANQCDIVAGGVDGSGIFKGVYVSGVHMCALLRTFQLAKVFMPVDMPNPVAAIGQNLADGIPITIVTRGVVGRDLDSAVGPARNDTQKAIWNIVRAIRADQPQVLITCVDLPVNASADVVQACLEPPLNEYRELMYADGTWYAPSVTDGKAVAKFLNEHRTDRYSAGKKEGGVKFNRKKFSWTDTSKLDPEAWTIGWTKVQEARPALAAPRRSDLKFTDKVKEEPKQIEWKGPSAAEATFQKALAKASAPQEILDAVSAYAPRASPAYETATLKTAAQACAEAAASFRSGGDAASELKALGMAVSTYLMANATDDAMKVAVGARDSGDVAKAAKLVMDCHTALGDLDKALEEAKAAKAKAASGDTFRLVVEAELAKGETDAAVACATEATQASDKKLQAAGFALLGEAQAAKGDKAGLAEAAAAQTKAAGLYKDLGMKAEQCSASEAAIKSLFANQENAKALALAKDMQASGKDAMGATGLKLAALAHVQEFDSTGKFLEGGQDAMLNAAKEAVSIFEDAANVAGTSAAKVALAKALLAADGSVEEAQQAAQSAAQGFKSAGNRAGRLSALVVSAQANLKRGNIYSAYWDAKQAVVEAEILQDEAGYEAAVSLVAQASSLSGKKMSVGGPVGMISDGGETGNIVTFV